MWQHCEAREAFCNEARAFNDEQCDEIEGDLGEEEIEKMALPFGDENYPFRPDEMASSPELVRLAKEEGPL